MPYKGDKKREHERQEQVTLHIKMPRFLSEALREKLAKEVGGRTVSTFIVDAVAEFCGLGDKIESRRKVKAIPTRLVSPDGQEFATDNLKDFCRKNLHLFPSQDVQIVYEGLSAARRRGGSWRGWRFADSGKVPGANAQV